MSNERQYRDRWLNLCSSESLQNNIQLCEKSSGITLMGQGKHLWHTLCALTFRPCAHPLWSTRVLFTPRVWLWRSIMGL